MAFLPKTTRYSRHTYGDDGVFGRRNIVSTSFSATDLGKASDADGDAIVAATATSDTVTTTITPTAQPSVPRALSVTVAADTAEDIKAGNITITGKNVEGKVITETFAVTADTAATIVGNKAFAEVTSIAVPAQDGDSVTVAVGTTIKFGIGKRSLSTASAKVLVITAAGVATLEAAAASAFSTSAVESNTVTPTTTPDGAAQMRLYTLNYNWHVDPTNGNPSYGV